MVATAALLAAACGDGSDDGAPADGGDATPAASAPASADDNAGTGDADGDGAADDGGAPAAGARTPASLAGSYTGTWSNTTFGSTGAIELTIEVDEAAGTATVTLDLGGNVFGLPDPDPETWEVPLSVLNGEPLQTTLFGPVIVSTNAVYTALSAVAGAVPADGIESASMDARIADDGSIEGTYEIVFPDANMAQGTFSLTRT